MRCSAGSSLCAMVLVPATTGLTAAGTDAGAGNWRMIVLTGPTQFAWRRPASTTGLDYQAELNVDQVGAVAPHGRPAQGDRLLEPGWRVALERDPARARRALQPASGSESGQLVSRPGREQPVCRSAVSVCESSVRGARVQLRDRRAVRRVEGGVVLQVSLQPSGTLEGGQRHQAADADNAIFQRIRRRTPCCPASRRRC